MVKVFISHQSADTAVAEQIAYRLKWHHQIESYLDVIDPSLRRNGEDLADHIRRQMGTCTQLLAVVSRATAASQWVPWEVGVATEKDFPLATFADGGVMPPEFLQKWPYLRSLHELDQYAQVSKATDRSYQLKRGSAFGMDSARRETTREFYSSLRRSLGQ